MCHNQKLVLAKHIARHWYLGTHRPRYGENAPGNAHDSGCLFVVAFVGRVPVFGCLFVFAFVGRVPVFGCLFMVAFVGRVPVFGCLFVIADVVS